MNPSSGQSVGAQAVAARLIEKSGVLAAAQILADLNTEEARDQSTFEGVIAEFHNDSLEDSLLPEIAVAFRLAKGVLDDAVVEMLRLYGLRRAHG